MNYKRLMRNITWYINAVLSVICLTMISQPAYTMSSELLLNQVKQDVPKIIECINQQAYYDTLEELDIMLESCTQQVRTSLDIERKNEESSNYYNALNKHLFEDEGFQNTVETIKARKFSTINNPLYDKGNKYQSIEERLIGIYTMPSSGHSPEGGAGFALLPNRKYAIYSFGYAEGGDWRVVNGKYLHLIPYRVTQPYYVYGRHNSDLGQRTKIRFNGNHFNDQTLVEYFNKPAKLPLLTPVFNFEADCFEWPYEAFYSDTHQYLTLAYNPDYDNTGNHAITTMNTFSNEQKFNDLYALSFSKMNKRETTKYIIKNDSLYLYSFSELKRLKKSDLPEQGSADSQFMEYISKEPTIAKSLFYNSGGKEINAANIDPNNYTYNEKLKAMVAINPCSDEYCPPVNDYNNYDIFYEYKLLDRISHNKSSFQLQPKPLIHAECQEAERWDSSP